MNYTASLAKQGGRRYGQALASGMWLRSVGTSATVVPIPIVPVVPVAPIPIGVVHWMSTSAQVIIRGAFGELNVYQPSEPIPGPDAIDALGRLNWMMGAWRQQPLTVPSIARVVVPLVANKGGPSNPYTIGPGGAIAQPKPPNQAAIVAVSLLLNASTPPVEIPRGIFTDAGWNAIKIKDLGNALFTNLYYNPTFADGLGAITLWPVPNATGNSLVLYLLQTLPAFTSLTAAYAVPDGYEEALIYNLAKRLAKPWGSTVDLTNEAAASLRLIKRANVKLSDLMNDAMFDYQRLYNINSGSN